MEPDKEYIYFSLPFILFLLKEKCCSQNAHRIICDTYDKNVSDFDISNKEHSGRFCEREQKREKLQKDRKRS